MGTGRIKNSTYNILSGFLYQLITLIMSFLSRTVFIRTLGIEYLGINSVYADVLNLLCMVDLGFNTTIAYSLYKPLAEQDEKKLTGLICFYKKIYRVIAIAVTLIGLAVIPFLKLIINTDKEIPHLVLYYLFSLAGVVISYLFVYRATILTADQKNYEVLKISIWIMLSKMILQIGFLLLLKNYIVYLTIGVLSQFINNLIVSKKADSMYPYIRNKERISLEEERSIFSNLKSVFIYKISGTMFTATDNILISFIVGTTMVGLYSNYLMVSSKLLLIIQIIFSAITASIGNVIVKDDSEKRYEVFSAVQTVSFILCGIIISEFCIMANDLIFTWLGGRLTISSTAILALTINTYLSCVLQPLWVYRDATGLYMKTKYIMLLGAVLNIVLSIIMGNLWGLTGILLASAVSRLSTYFWYEPKILFKEYFERKATGYYLSLLSNAILVTSNIILLSLLSRNIIVNGWLMLIVKGAFVGIFSTVIFCMAYARTEGFQIIKNKVELIISKACGGKWRKTT
ncbi:lipopolysaccharide biosynthesis protein [Anaeromicropila herbilytica]|uniref:Sugar translocase n=1 Tax=Anaeromicropila herbilytica TaxID=2785025 RepID=A0A7R7EHV8_9FIRM|nr:oligosaccharide flippase family protein [Anaeromicropila herbilytica]BCN29023.1 sugar translocase [Anaeromicropila herbilytica]